MAGAGQRQKLFDQGVAHGKAGRFAKALPLFERVLRLGEDSAVFNALAVTRKNLGDIAGARAAYSRAASLDPFNADLLFNMAKLEMDCGRPAAGSALLTRAIALRPSPGAWKNLGICRLDLEESIAAVQSFQNAVALAPKDPVLWSYIGAAWQQAGDLVQAEAAHARALALQPENPEILNNLGSTRLLQRRLADAETAFRRALAVWPDYAEARYGLAWTLLHQKRFVEAWPHWEQRLKRRKFSEPPANAPLWDGKPFKGTLLVHREIGFGDSINFARLLPKARELCDRVVFVCQPAIVALLEGAFDGIEVIGDDQPWPKADRFAYVMSLPALLVTDESDIDGTAYLRPNRPFDLECPPGLKRVGICWSSTRKGLDPHRFLPGAVFAESVLAGHDPAGMRFFNFQKGAETIDKAPVIALAQDLEPRLNDFADTAAALAQMDLMVTVDTAVAHLAGALGVPALVLLHHGADWRWFDQDVCPWYEKSRLLRQPAPGVWPPLLSEARTALDQFLAG